MSKYKLVTFDVTNTLLRLRSSVGHQYSKAASLYDVPINPTDPIDPDQLTASFTTSWKRLNRDHPNYGRTSTSVVGWRAWWTELVRMTFAGAGHPLEDEGRLGSVASHLIAFYATDSCWDIVPGALQTLTALRSLKQTGKDHHSEGGLILGIISNFDPQLTSVLRHTGLAQYFDFVVNSYHARCYKPQSDIFRVALLEASKLMGDKNVVLPNEALHVGNDVKLDYDAARCAGWNALLVVDEQEHLNPTTKVDPRYVVRGLRDVKSHVMLN